MKKIIIATLIALAGHTAVQAQNEEYLAAMQEVVDSTQKAPFGTDLRPFANQFERIADNETKEWLPRYWASLCYLFMTYAEPAADKRDLLLDKADQLLVAADAISSSNDELEVLRANIASGRVGVDPMGRWQKYGAITAAALEKAKKINPNNPRIYLHEAQGLFYTPEAYGGGQKKALPLIKTALEHYEKFKPSTTIMPAWGKSLALYMQAEAEK